MVAGVVMAVSAVLVVMVLVGTRVHHRNATVRATIAAIDELTREIAAWESEHRPRRRALEQHMTDVELRVIHAEDSAFHSSSHLRSARSEVLRRMEQVERDVELHVLVAQGRIPSEHVQ